MRMTAIVITHSARPSASSGHQQRVHKHQNTCINPCISMLLVQGNLLSNNGNPENSRCEIQSSIRVCRYPPPPPHSRSKLVQRKKLSLPERNPEKNYSPSDGSPQNTCRCTEMNRTLAGLGVHPLPQEPQVLHLLPNEAA